MDISPEVISRNIPIEKAIVVGSACLLAYAEKYGLDIPSDVEIHDIDITTDETTYSQLAEHGWTENVYRGVKTLRDSKPQLGDGRKSAHLYDIGTSAHNWSFDELQKYTIEHEGILYMDPLRLLVWKLSLARKKDTPHIRFLSQAVLPVWVRDQLDN